MSELAWTDIPPTVPGRYWYYHAAGYEHPALVRMEAEGESFTVHFPGLPVAVPLRLLAGGRWAGPVSPISDAPDAR